MAYMHADLYSNVLKRSVCVDLILPDDLKCEKWKTLYLLHGFSDDYSMWQRQSGAERYAVVRNDLVIVIPETGLNWYTDTAQGERYQEYITHELVEMTRRLLPRLSHRREDTFVAGLSMGGYGALKCALTYPDIYSKAASFSGALDIRDIVNGKSSVATPAFWRDVFGTTQELEGSRHDLFALAEQVKRPKPDIFLWCGIQDSLYPQSVKMRDHLTKLGYNVKYRETEGDHLWKYWDRELSNAIDWIYGREAEKCR